MSASVFIEVQDGRQGEPAITRLIGTLGIEGTLAYLRVTLQAIVVLIMLITLPAHRSDQ